MRSRQAPASVASTSGSIRGPSTPNVGRRVAERADPAAKPAGQDLLELGQRADRRLLDPGDPAGGRGPQADGDGDGLGVVEQQRRKLAAVAEPVAAGDAGRGLDRIAERAQFVDVAADRAGADLEAVGELLAGPFPAHLEQRKQCE